MNHPDFLGAGLMQHLLSWVWVLFSSFFCSSQKGPTTTWQWSRISENPAGKTEWLHSRSYTSLKQTCWTRCFLWGHRYFISRLKRSFYNSPQVWKAWLSWFIMQRSHPQNWVQSPLSASPAIWGWHGLLCNSPAHFSKAFETQREGCQAFLMNSVLPERV